MSVKGRIINSRSALSEAEAKVANYILKKPEEVLKMTVTQLAKVSASSPASVIRLIKRLDIGSFTTLKILLSSDLTKNNENTAGYQEITKNEPLTSIKEKLLTSALQSIKETVDQVSENEVGELIEVIKKSRRMLLFGIGASSLTAENISQKWNRIGYTAASDSDLNMLLPKVANADKSDLIWIVSNSGESPEAILAARIARERGLKVVSLTRFGNNSVSGLSDIAIHTSQPVESTNRIAATNSLLAQFMIIDTIFYYFVSKTFAQSEKALRDSADIINEYKKFINKKHKEVREEP